MIDDSQLVNDTIKELEKKLRKEPGPMSTSLDTVIVVDCLPVVGTDKLEKLKNVLKRTFGACAEIQIETSAISMPMDQKTKKTFG